MHTIAQRHAHLENNVRYGEKEREREREKNGMDRVTDKKKGKSRGKKVKVVKK